MAGTGFALLFIALDRAGTGGSVAVAAWAGSRGSTGVAWAAPARNRPGRKAWSRAWRLGLAAGVLGATGAGQLAIVAVVTALYPAVTILLARLALHERWSRLQILGLVASAVAVAAISIG